MNEAAEMGSQFPAILLFALWWGLLLALDIVFPRADPPPPGPAVQHVSGADAGAEDGADADAAAWQAVAKADPAFDGAAFLRGAATAYEAILCAFAQEERETLRRLLSAEVLAAFEDVQKANQDRDRLKNEAQAYANDVVPRARGQAARLLEEAEGYKQQVSANAQGEAARFTQVLAEYQKAPAVTRERPYLDTMQQVMNSSSKVVVDQKGNGSLLYLPLDKLQQITAQPYSGAPETLRQPAAAPPSSSSSTTGGPAALGGGRELLGRERGERP